MENDYIFCSLSEHKKYNSRDDETSKAELNHPNISSRHTQKRYFNKIIYI